MSVKTNDLDTGQRWPRSQGQICGYKKKDLVTKMTIYKMEFLIVITNVNLFIKCVKCQGYKVKYQQKYSTGITRNILVKYQSSRIQYLNVIYRAKVFKKLARLYGQGLQVKNVCNHSELLSHLIPMWNSSRTHGSKVISKV